jgi:hypothetical protein
MRKRGVVMPTKFIEARIIRHKNQSLVTREEASDFKTFLTVVR